jgi:hypothetical protein
VNFGLPLNPGYQSLAPWLANFAPSFEKYRWKKLRFIYRTRCSTSTTGAVSMAIDYNAGDSGPETEQIMSTYMGMKEGQAWAERIVVDLDPSKVKDFRYVRTPAGIPTGQDVKTYDAGQFFLACTDGVAGNAPWGKLWVEYEVELSIPQIDAGDFINYNGTGNFLQGAGVTASAPLGTLGDGTVYGNIMSPLNTTTLTFDQPGTYLLYNEWQGTAITSTGYSATAYAGAVLTQVQNILINGAANTATSVYQVLISTVGQGVTFALGTATAYTAAQLRAAAYNLG